MTAGKRAKTKVSVATHNAKAIEEQEIVEKEATDGFPIVGIGASAGGLEALELFLANVPENSGMAFVIVQHLDPTHKGVLVELLQRGTAMPVVQVKDRMRIKPNCVYVIAPNKDMSILHGVLHLLDPIAPRGLRLPIDFFFRALADDQQNHSIGVILSGMGSDGTLGLRAIKEKAGVVFVQDPTTAKFDAMPRSAIDAGLADMIAPVEVLPGKISTYLKHVPLITKSEHTDHYIARSALEKVVILLRSKTGHDFSLYKRTTIYRRIERRMGLHQIDRIANYVRFLQENPQEVELLFHELLIGVTSFFRDPETWEQLKAEILPALLTVEKIVTNIIKDQTAAHLDRDIDFVVQPLPNVEADGKMVEMIFRNLIENAVKFTSKRKNAHIEISSRQENDEQQFFVKDNGAGFDMKFKDKLFVAFQRLHLENEFEGNGIGLTTVARLVTKHGGRVWAEGEVDKGATFYFTLPLNTSNL